MLSNQLSDLSRRQHRRQNSTPTIIDAPKVPLLPAIQGLHLRGLSLDQGICPQQQQHTPKQGDRTVSTNQGLQHQQHTLRETQQQRLSRPGQNKLQGASHLEDRLNDSQVESRTALDQESSRDPFSCNEYDKFDNLDNSDQYGSLEDGDISGFDGFQSLDTNMSSGDLLEGFGLDAGSGPVKYDVTADIEKILGGSSTPVMEQAPSGSGKELQRPFTPPNQTSDSSFYITPAATPFDRVRKSQSKLYTRTAQSSPARGDPNEIIEASRSTTMQRGLSCQEFIEHANYARRQSLPSPPNTAPLVSASAPKTGPVPTPNFMNLSALQMAFPINDNGYESSYYSPMSNDVSPTMSSFQSSPEMAHMSLFGEDNEGMPDLSVPGAHTGLVGSRSAVELGSYEEPAKRNLLPRSQSISELELDPSIDASIEETGVTIDEIASFIAGPDPADGRWMCLYPSCNKKFGRKENIKSHVQTHLGDRQFRCNHCQKCFVRQHDLKRHAKIHSGVKPYPCACGNSFARHDALTRHRQRNVCIGGFGGGKAKKEIKRGRPKKTARPDTEDRLEKAARTRQRVLERKYALSVSGSSECSFPSPPPTFDDLQMRGTTPFDNTPSLEPASIGLSADILSYTPPDSPGYSTGNPLSPQLSQHSRTPKAVSMSPLPRHGTVIGMPELQDLLPTRNSPNRGSASVYGTPPELELTSSSPAASKFFDFDGSSEGAEKMTRSSRTCSSQEATQSFDFPDLNDSVDKLFFEDFAEQNGLMSLEKDQMPLMDDPFGPSDSWNDEFTASSNSFY